MSQVKTRLVKLKTIIGSHYFTRGIKDYGANLGFSKDYESWDTNQQWCYERGRQFAAATNGSIPNKVGRGNKLVNNVAVRKYVELMEDNLVI